MGKRNRIKLKKKNKKTICLNMIVKDEAHIIMETLESIKKYIDYWVICDTGSTDNTKQIITEFFSNEGIPGELIEEPWEDHFGYNRTVAIQACKKKADYVWVIDADDLVVGDFDFPPNMNEDCYGLTIGEGFVYMRQQIFNNKLDWKYSCVRHEFPKCTNKDIKPRWIKGNYHIASRRLGARSQDPQKYLKDALSLESYLDRNGSIERAKKLGKLKLAKYLSEEPDQSVRYKFYIGQSYLDYGDYDNAIKWYQERINSGGWFEEIYYSHYRIAQAKRNRNDDWAEVEKAYMEAWKNLPSRAEPLYEIAKYYREVRKDYETAYKYSKLGSTIPFPENQVLFLSKDVYDWKIWDELGVNSYWIGKYEESFEIGNKLLRDNNIPFNERERIERNRDFNVSHLNTNLPVTNPSINNNNDIIFTITTCKRLSLFIKTIQSFLYCCQDVNKIGKWFCVDDNSSEEDRATMKRMFPFFEFYFKNPEEKGHPQSMNIIRNKIMSDGYKWVIHMEDDWYFFEPRPYISDSIKIMGESDIYGQVLFNRNYAETLSDRNIAGGILKTADGLRYLIHEHYEKGSSDYIFFMNKNRGKLNCCYWPHYSLRPSLLRSSIFKEVGKYQVLSSHFEMEWAHRYFSQGYKSVFLDTISCLHTGKLTSEKEGNNAYSLNGIDQFGPKQSKDQRSLIKVKGWDSFGNDVSCSPNSNIRDLFDILDDAICINSLGYVKNILTPVSEWINVSNKYKDFYLLIDKTKFKPSPLDLDQAREKGIDMFDWLVDHVYVTSEQHHDLTNFTNFDNNLKTIAEDAQKHNYEIIVVTSSPNLLFNVVHDINKNKDWDIIVHKDYKIISSQSYDKIINDKDLYTIESSLLKPDKIKVVCLNLERRPDRKRHAIETFNKAGLDDYEIYSAVDGKLLIPNQTIIKLTEGNNYRYRRGIIGISLSYMGMWDQLKKDNNYDYYMIFEDDIELVSDFKSKLNLVLDQLNTIDWDILMLGLTYEINHRRQNESLYRNNNNNVEITEINSKYYLGGTFAYIINKRGATILLSYIEKYKLKDPIDFIIQKCWKNNLIKMYEVRPHLAITEYYHTSSQIIDTDIQLDFSNIFDCPKEDKMNVCVTITTCKRLELFNIMMTSLWDKCSDINKVKSWYCVDDGSSNQDIMTMKRNWPFLTIISKTNENKGHVSSINLISKLGQGYDYVFHLEDDWLFTQSFTIKSLIENLKLNHGDQVICVGRSGTHIPLSSGVYNYLYNYDHPAKPNDKKEFDKVLGKTESETKDNGWWWPGFSLNPSIFNAKLLSYLNIAPTISDFEYELATQMYKDEVKILFIPLCHHIGTQTSAYVLNGNPRSYEK